MPRSGESGTLISCHNEAYIIYKHNNAYSCHIRSSKTMPLTSGVSSTGGLVLVGGSESLAGGSESSISIDSTLALAWTDVKKH